MKRSKLIVAVALVCAMFCSPSAMAKKGNGQGHGKSEKAEKDSEKAKKHDEVVKHGEETTSASSTSTPPGWSHGKKTGWGGSAYPPGWSKWKKDKQDKWISDRDRADEDIYQVIIKHGIPEKQGNEIISAFNEGLAGGVLINDAKNRVVNALQDEKGRQNLMIDTTQSMLELMKE